ncbi:MATE family efflux transporter, partial [Parabacteroides sp. OttesenSCG-928-G21]|nr:MATE family efflux transporter [Parabacteroides sp. OttesenSCG-928-G21]
MNARILGLAIPAIITNITVPLLGLIDIAIVGHLGSAVYIGAIAIGGLLFNIMYWLFGFLRMGTSGLTAQAYGRNDTHEVTRILFRAVGIGIGIAFLLILFQYPLQQFIFLFIKPSEEVSSLAILYYRICIWGAPAVLGFYGLSGWFIGMQNTKYPMLIAIAQNIINIICSLFFVFVLKMKVEGVALGTLIAQYGGFIMAILLWRVTYYKSYSIIKWKELWNKADMKQFFQLNSDIFLRTLCLVLVTTFFTSVGAQQGDLILAVNTLLMQLFTLFSYFMDGFAYAGEALTGLFIGSKNKTALKQMIHNLFVWGTGLALLFTGLYALGGKNFLSLLTNDSAVINASTAYFWWTLAIPLAGFSAFLWDGIFIG